MTLALLEFHQGGKAVFPIRAKGIPDEPKLIEPPLPVGRHIVDVGALLIHPCAKPIIAFNMTSWDTSMTLALFVNSQAPIPLVPSGTYLIDHFCNNGRS